jgi:carbamoyl-phosphate synthase small subunit
MQKRNPATLALEDGTLFEGWSFGAPVDGFGEACFNTSMTGYQEVLTDPSYAGQMVAMTYPHIGNTGANDLDMESARPWVGGFIVREATPAPSNFRSLAPLEAFLIKHQVPGICGVDTRGLTRRLRDHGAQRGAILQGRVDKARAVKKVKASPRYEAVDWVAKVSAAKAYTWSQGLQSGIGELPPPEEQLVMPSRNRGKALPRPSRSYKVVAIDCGIKRNILRNLVSAGCAVTVVPAGTSSRAILGYDPDGIFLSNGPGDPQSAPYLAQTVRELIGKRPIFGICLGHQMLALALGGKTYKMKFGHRGGNQPVMDLKTRKVEITSQNHGFAVDPKSFKERGVQLTHINLNDRTSEGLEYAKGRLFSVQYHPEASPGPHDAHYLFQRFNDLMRKG